MIEVWVRGEDVPVWCSRIDYGYLTGGKSVLWLYGVGLGGCMRCVAVADVWRVDIDA